MITISIRNGGEGGFGKSSLICPSGYRLFLEEKPESEDDEKLLGEYYTQLKGAAKGNGGYTNIPRFYAKVSAHQSAAPEWIWKDQGE